MFIDNIHRHGDTSRPQSPWKAISDRVMGGVSRACLRHETYRGRACIRLHGEVCMDNNGGFIQLARDLRPDGSSIDVHDFAGLRLVVLGNEERYSAHLRTANLTHPWQSYRASFRAPSVWHEVRLPFQDFRAHRTKAHLNLAQLRRVGIVAIGRPFTADLRVAEVEIYR